MKKLLILFILLIFAIAPAFAKTKIKVLKVYDGDTVLAKIYDNTFRIRLIGIDCFEGTESERAKWQARKYKMTLDNVVAYGNIAGEILEEKLNKKDVYFEFRGIDKYNRALGILYVNDVNINNELLNTPYCKVYKLKK